MNNKTSIPTLTSLVKLALFAESCKLRDEADKAIGEIRDRHSRADLWHLHHAIVETVDHLDTLLKAVGEDR